MAFEAVYTKTVVSSTLTTGSGVEAAPPSGFTWIVVDITAVMNTPGQVGQLELDADFQAFVYWSQPHGMKRTWHWRGRRAILENILGTFTSDIAGSCGLSITAYELSTTG